MAKDFFDVVNNYDPIKEVLPLAVQKFHMDMETEKFKIAKDQADLTRAAAIREIDSKNKFMEKMKVLGPNTTPTQMLEASFETGYKTDLAMKALETLNKPVALRPGGQLINPSAPDKPIASVPALPKTGMLSNVSKLKSELEEAKKSGDMATVDILTKAITKATKLPNEPSTEAYKVGHIQPFQEGRELVYKEYQGKGEWKVRKDLGGGPKDVAPSQYALTPETLKALATRFGETGDIPGMGMGKAATEARSQVLNEWAATLKNTGTTVQDNIARQAAVKASRQELNKLQSQRGVVMAFASTAEKNLQLAVDLSEKVDRTGVPVINRWLIAGKRSITGDPEVAKFEAALRTGINEYAKVTSSATGGGITSDTARKEVEAMLNSAQTVKQVREVMEGVLKKDLANRRAGYDEQIKFIQESLSGKKEIKQSQKIGRFTVEVE